jgi:hypothetical protein
MKNNKLSLKFINKQLKKYVSVVIKKINKLNFTKARYYVLKTLLNNMKKQFQV